jgi:hypothetical protein
MLIDDKLLDSVRAEAKASPRLRMNYDLRNSVEDGSQRMLNALVMVLLNSWNHYYVRIKASY